METYVYDRDIDLQDIGHLYLIIDPHVGSRWIKVGKTNNPDKRLYTYNAHLPEDRFSFEYLTEEIYNLSKCEEMLIEFIKNTKKYKSPTTRREWFMPVYHNKKTQHKHQSIISHMRKLENQFFYGGIDWQTQIFIAALLSLN